MLNAVTILNVTAFLWCPVVINLLAGYFHAPHACVMPPVGKNSFARKHRPEGIFESGSNFRIRPRNIGVVAHCMMLCASGLDLGTNYSRSNYEVKLNTYITDINIIIL